ncbi:MAG: pyridoxamine 5'-phosphate oxidase [bacterium]
MKNLFYEDIILKIDHLIGLLMHNKIEPPFVEIGNDPFQEFHQWFGEAKKTNLSNPDAMTLATATSDGKPSARTVLLKKISSEGFYFYTNYESRKSKELVENPFATLLFHWDELRRQVIIEGQVVKAGFDRSNEYFQSRPLDSRLAAWASQQSHPIDNREALVQKLEDVKERFPDDKTPLPPFWGGFYLLPTRFEFWLAGDSRLHHRTVFEKEGHQWKKSLLQP